MEIKNSIIFNVGFYWYTSYICIFPGGMNGLQNIMRQLQHGGGGAGGLGNLFGGAGAPGGQGGGKH